jgi:hypothetical protein
VLLICVALVARLYERCPDAGRRPPVNWGKIDLTLKAAMKVQPSHLYPVLIEFGHPGDKKPTPSTTRAAEALAYIKDAGGCAKNKLGLVGGATADLNWNMVAKLSLNPRVRRISLDRLIQASGDPAPLASMYTQLVRAPVDAYAAGTSDLNGKDNRGVRPSDIFCVNVYSMIRGCQPLGWKDPNHMGVNWTNLTWDNLTWDNLTRDNLTWDNLTWDSTQSATGWDAAVDLD